MISIGFNPNDNNPQRFLGIVKKFKFSNSSGKLKQDNFLYI